MQFTELTITIPASPVREELTAMLTGIGFEGFEETDKELKAYIPEDLFHENEAADIIKNYDLSYSVASIAPQNWNAEWEKSFEPVVVDDFCTVRADFHLAPVTTKYEIIITPKMSFGTGHHATTRLMISNMRRLDLADKTVFDFGTGTGILAILAEMLGATSVLAVDNDEWSYDNALENIERNHCSRIDLLRGSTEAIGERKFDVILANINRNILLQFMDDLYSCLNPGGYILMSGLLAEDRVLMLEAASRPGFSPVAIDELNNWISILLSR